MRLICHKSLLPDVSVLSALVLLTACGGEDTSAPAPTTSSTTQREAMTQSVMTEGAEIIEQVEEQVQQVMAEAETRIETAVEDAQALAEEAVDELEDQAKEEVENELRNQLRSIGN